MSKPWLPTASAVLILLLALPGLAAAQWQLRDTFNNQIVVPGSGLSVLEDIVPLQIAQRVYDLVNTASGPIPLGTCSILGHQSFTISVLPYPPGQSNNPLTPGFAHPFAIQHAWSSVGVHEAQVVCSGGLLFTVRGRVLSPNPYLILETQAGANVAKNSTVSFGTVPFGGAVDKDFRIINFGNQALSVNLSVSGTGYSYSITSGGRASSIPAGGEMTFRLRLQGSTAGSAPGQLSISSNDPNNNPYNVTLSGTVGNGPQIRITDKSNGGAVVTKGSTVNLGSTPLNTPLSRTFTLANTGGAALTISNPTTFLTGTGYSLVTPPSSTVNAGSSTSFTLRFQSATLASSLGVVSLSSNDADDNPFAFNVQVSAAAPRIRLESLSGGGTFSPGGTVNLGTTEQNLSVTHYFRIHNDGNAPLTLSLPAVSGTGFSLNTGSSQSIAAGGDSDFSVSFQSATTGSHTGSVSLSHNDSATTSPFILNLQAQVSLPALPTVRLSAADTEAAESAASPGQFTLTRTGSTAAPLTVTLSRGGTASNSSDYASIATSQTFAIGQSTLNLALTPGDDTAIEGIETATLSLVAGSGYQLGSPNSGTVEISDNDYTPCTPSATRLCLQNGRFEATLVGTVGSTPYTGQSIPMGDAAGGFWLFSPNNVEVGVKVLDAQAINGRFWAFHGAATDVAYTLSVTDRANPSRVKTFTKPAGTYCGGSETGLFVKSLALDALDEEKPGFAAGESMSKAFTCAPDATTTCLTGGRFRVRIRQGTTYRQVYQATADTGFFWFYSQENLEMFVKVLDARTINGKFWVFFGSMTDQAYTIEVTDSTTEVMKSYSSPGPFCGASDTAAF